MGREIKRIFGKDLEYMETYIRYKEPDYDLLSDLVLEAKGEIRSLTQFSKDCNTSVATLSRLIGKMHKPSSDMLLVNIAQNADIESNVTIEKMMPWLKSNL